MSQRESQKAASHDAIVRSAAALVRQAGVEGTSVPASMRGAGLTQGAFYAHFASKDDLLDEAFALAMSDVGVLITDAAEGLSGPEAVVAIADRYLSEEHRDHPEIGCPLPGMLGEAATNRGDNIDARLVAGSTTMRERLGVAADGEIAADALLASVVLMIGGQVVARALRDTALSDEVLRACRTAVAQLSSGNSKGAQR